MKNNKIKIIVRRWDDKESEHKTLRIPTYCDSVISDVFDTGKLGRETFLLRPNERIESVHLYHHTRRLVLYIDKVRQ